MVDVRTNAQLAGLREQRDAATTHVITLVGEIAALQERVAYLDSVVAMEREVSASLTVENDELKSKIEGWKNAGL